MENTLEPDRDDTSEFLDEPFPTMETVPSLNNDLEVRSQPPEFITSRQTKNEVRVRQTVGEDGSLRKEAHVRRKVGKDGKKEMAGQPKKENGGHTESINSTILVSVAVAAVVGAIIAKLVLARKLTGA